MVLEVVRWNPAVERRPMSPCFRVFGAALGCAWETERQSGMGWRRRRAAAAVACSFSLLDRYRRTLFFFFLSFPAL